MSGTLKVNEQIWKDYCLGTDMLDENGRHPHKEKFQSPVTSVMCDGYSCVVIADKHYAAGDIIEEVPILVTETVSQTCLDPILLSKSFSYPSIDKIFNEFGNPIVLAPGNFILYRQISDGNASFEFNRTFNMVTIRSRFDIEKGDEITLNSVDNRYGFTDIEVSSLDVHKKENKERSKEKMGGCNCGKKQKHVTKIMDGSENKKPEPKPKENIEPTPKKFENVKFKSMVDGTVLKSIKANRKIDP